MSACAVSMSFSPPEGAGDMTLSDFAGAVSAGYTSLGAVSVALVGRMCARKMPAGFGVEKMRKV